MRRVNLTLFLQLTRSHRLAYKSSSKSAKRECCLVPCLEARSAIVRARVSERVARASESSTCFPCWKSNQVTLFWRELFRVRSILGDPGAACRDEGIFVGESLLQLGDEPLGTYSYRTSSRSIWISRFWLARKMFFWPISEEDQPVPSYTKLLSSSIAQACRSPQLREPFKRGDSRRDFHKNSAKSSKSQT